MTFGGKVWKVAAMMTAFGAKKDLNVLGVTCVAGNVPLNLTSVNALKICELSGFFSVPVFRGSSAPLRRKLITAEHVHGKTGLDRKVHNTSRKGKKQGNQKTQKKHPTKNKT